MKRTTHDGSRPGRRWILWLVALAVAWSLPADPTPSSVQAASPRAKKKRTKRPQRSRLTHTNRINSRRDFRAFSKEVANERFTKFVLSVDGQRISYFDVKTYPVHKTFVFAQIYREKVTRARLKLFRKNYSAEKPEFILGYVVHHLVPNIWTFSFWEGDKAQPEHIKKSYEALKKTFYLGKKLKFRPDSTAQERVAKKLRDVPVITNDRIYNRSKFTAFNQGRAVGVLRIVPKGAAFESLAFDRKEIVILPTALSDITPVSGIISEQFSTPLSHVNLRAKAWNIPNIGLKGASKRYAHLKGQVVYFAASHKRHRLRKATPTQVSNWRAARVKKRKILIPKADLKTRDLRRLTALRASDFNAFGAKAANLGVVAAAGLKRVHVPVGFAIPIAYYDDHLRRAGLHARIGELLKNPQFKRSIQYRKHALAKLREAIRRAPLSRRLLAQVMFKVRDFGTSTGVFVRSSTNAEDLPRFNGAGLYDTVANAVGEKAVGEAIKRVWASVWNLVAYEERAYFGIVHQRVFGAILIQTAVSPTAAGVLVTQHPNNPAEKTTYTINAKRGLGMKVVNGKKIPETVLYDWKNGGLRVLSRSDEKTKLVVDPKGGVRSVPIKRPGRPVLSDHRARKLGRAARRIVRLMKSRLPLDMEWLFEGSKLYIVQVRPYVVHSPKCPCNRLVAKAP